MLRQHLNQKLLQKLSPQQIQLMKLLQVPTDQLEQRIKEELEINPALEENSQDVFDADKPEAEENSSEGDMDESESFDDSPEYDDDNINLSDYFDETDNTASYKYNSMDYNPDDDEDRSSPISINVTFHEYLEQQLGLLPLGDREYLIAKQIIGSIDEDGYMRRELEAIVDDLAFSSNINSNQKELIELLSEIQKFDPAGVGACDLQECLLLQLHRIEHKNVYTNLAIDIITNSFDEFTKKHYDKLQKIYEVDIALIKKAIEEILKLNPKPGSAYNEGGAKMTQHIIPDFLIENNNGELVLRLNSKNAPELRVSDTFKEMLTDYNKTKEKTKQQKEAVMFIKQKIDGAKWFIDAVKQRQQTLLKTMRAIMEFQYKYFLSGDETDLKPMILKDIASITHLDISTVSRVANSKYVQTEFGTFLLKNFFSESLSTDSGEEVSTREVKKILTDHISVENKKKPLSDEKLTQILNQAGYNIARRTVAKYREQLNIPVARLRKEL
ncbi:MAG: RNA polymerase factor sigma-54 [Bacteroidota bacterium]